MPATVLMIEDDPKGASYPPGNIWPAVASRTRFERGGSLAEAFLCATFPDCILLDLNLPYGCCNKVSSAPALPGPRCIGARDLTVSSQVDPEPFRDADVYDIDGRGSGVVGRRQEEAVMPCRIGGRSALIRWVADHAVVGGPAGTPG